MLKTREIIYFLKIIQSTSIHSNYFSRSSLLRENIVILYDVNHRDTRIKDDKLKNTDEVFQEEKKLFYSSIVIYKLKSMLPSYTDESWNVQSTINILSIHGTLLNLYCFSSSSAINGTSIGKTVRTVLIPISISGIDASGSQSFEVFWFFSRNSTTTSCKKQSVIRSIRRCNLPRWS